jgi:hypothetical protein
MEPNTDPWDYTGTESYSLYSLTRDNNNLSVATQRATPTRTLIANGDILDTLTDIANELRNGSGIYFIIDNSTGKVL